MLIEKRFKFENAFFTAALLGSVAICCECDNINKIFPGIVNVFTFSQLISLGIFYVKNKQTIRASVKFSGVKFLSTLFKCIFIIVQSKC